MKDSKIISSVIIALAIVILGFSLKSGIDNFVNKDRNVVVKGLSEREVPADKVTWPVMFKVVGNDLQSLYNEINVKSGKIKKYLQRNGIEDGEISVNAPEVVDLEADRYSSNNRQYRYNVTGIITVTSGKVAKVRELIASQGELLKEGVAVVSGDYNNQIVYEYTAFNELKPEMIAEATKNARKSAEQFAQDSDSEIGRIQWANQGQFSIENRDANTPYIKKIRVVTSIRYELKD